MKQWNWQKKIFLKSFFILFLFFNTVNAEIFIIGYANVSDADTIKISNYKIRLHGIDAPEKKQLCQKPYFNLGIFSLYEDYLCGEFATNKLKEFIDSEFIIECKVKVKKDFFGRHIGTCFKNNTNINQWLVENGYAVAFTKYSKDYIKYEEIAKNNKSGIWSGKFLMPWEWRKKNK
ncbi:thermonuclease family protein [Candidatus Pelagibacter sp.]|nr:thermonuclease family protein [Candidatus Pelagibacter sp.]